MLKEVRSSIPFNTKGIDRNRPDKKEIQQWIERGQQINAFICYSVFDFINEDEFPVYAFETKDCAHIKSKYSDNHYYKIVERWFILIK